ncbi:ERAD-associated protein [Dipsacomyces acuminosporus]|nr:ERAD-associated protein [Dipsacomyces acuminosporus]
MRLAICILALVLAIGVTADENPAPAAVVVIAADNHVSIDDSGVSGAVDRKNNEDPTNSRKHLSYRIDSNNDDDDDSGDSETKEELDRKRSAFDQSMRLLENYQSAINSQRMPHPPLTSTFMSQRDLLGSLPRPIRSYARSAISAITKLASRHKQQSTGDRLGPPKGMGTVAWKEQKAGAKEAVQVLKSLAENGYEDAIFALANMEMYGKYGTQIDLEAAFSHYQQLSDASGNATAQYMLGFFYATALGGVEQSNSLSLLYNTFAAMQGYTPAEVTLGFKHLSGIGTPMSCNEALGYYQSVARKSIRHYASGPPLGRQLPYHRVHLTDEFGGAYGVRTGVSSIRRTVKREDFNELLEYHQFHANKGSLKSCLTLADLYYHGHKYMPRKFSFAVTYLTEIIEKTFTPNGKLRNGLTQPEAHIAAEAAGMFGIMNWRGDGGKPNTALALKWLQIGARLGHGSSLNALGKMYLEGAEVATDAEKAKEYFKLAAEKQHPGGQVNFAMSVIDTMPKVAVANLKKAAENGHILAHYYLAEMYANGIVVEASCRMAASMYKYIAEKGDWLHSPVPDAYAAYKRGNMQVALLEYMRAAEMGYDVGQLNAAFLLEHVSGLYPSNKSQLASNSACTGCTTKLNGDDNGDGNDSSSKEGDCACPKPLFKSREAYDFQTLTYWTRAANQNVPDARVKQGDHYFYGRGTKPSVERAAAAYTIAAETEGNSFAMWNLGWMYENGIGVKRDFHLAKRWYDKSLEMNKSGKLANQFSLARLCIKYLWGKATGKDVGEGPLFFAPKPVTKDEEESSNAAAGAAQGESKQGGIEGLNRAGQNGEDDGVDNGDRDEMAVPIDDDDNESTFAENMFFIALLVTAGWMFLPFR